MVGTRKHPDADFPSTPTPPASIRSTSESTSNSQTLTRRAKSVSRRSSSKPRVTSSQWSHTPSNFTLLWLALSCPFIVWDVAYVLLRPHTMPGGKIHSPLWKPYALYGTVDHSWGWPGLQSKDGWVEAQSVVNLLETLGYVVYLYLVYSQGVEQDKKGRGAPKKLSTSQKLSANVKRLGNARVLTGRTAATAVLLAYSTLTVTVAKTVLFGLTEAYTGFSNIRHNDPLRLFFLWIIPNGAWLFLPSYFLYVYSVEILEALSTATGSSRRSA